MGLRVIFSGIMSERALFERNLEKIKNIIDERYPQNTVFTQTLYDIATRRALIDIDSLKVLLENGFGGEGILSNILGKIEEENEKLTKRKSI